MSTNNDTSSLPTPASAFSAAPSTRLSHDKPYTLSIRPIIPLQNNVFNATSRSTRNNHLKTLKAFWKVQGMEGCAQVFADNTKCKSCSEESRMARKEMTNHIRTDQLTLHQSRLWFDMRETDVCTLNQEKLDNFMVRWLEAEDIWFLDNRILRTKNASCEGLYLVQNRGEAMKGLIRKEGLTGLRSREYHVVEDFPRR